MSAVDTIQLQGCKWQAQHEAINAKCSIYYKTSLQELYSTPQYNYTVFMLFCMGGNITVHFILLILFADFLLSVYPEPFKQVCLKNIYIIAFASHSKKANGA